ncbi:extracellular solute-binding protein [Paenibacillus sp. FSL R10-2734]|uniref:extracellular solute-binding protein n=1 Tax=Paenibacillus sp. FSL R10-2734 TaxID=2954691 RepID=UPI0030DB590A
MGNNKTARKPAMILLAVTILAGLITGCSGNNSENSSTSTSASGTSETENNTSSTGKIVELKLFVDQPWWPLKDWSGSIPEEITKQTGVKLNITVATDEKQLPLMIASGDLPDLVVTGTNAQLKRLADPSLSYSWQELIDKYAPDFKIDPQYIAVNTADDGSYYTIRNNFSTSAEWKANEKYALNTGAGISVRSDIMEELGNPKVETLSDLNNLFAKVKDKHPEMVPLVLNPNPAWAKGYFATQFGAEKEGFGDKEGQLVHTLRTPELEKMYLYMNELYRSGYVKAENFAYKNEDQAKQIMTSGKGFAYAWTIEGADRLTSETKASGYKWVQLPVKISDTFKVENYGSGWQGVFISKNNKNPEASIKLMQFLMSEEGQRLALWGIEGQDYKMSDDGGYPVFTYDRSSDEVKNEKGIYWWGLLAGSAVNEALGNYVPGTETTKASQQLSELITFKPEVGLVQPAADSQEEVIKNNIATMMQTEEAKIYLATSEEEAKKAFANMAQQADKMGLENLETWANTKYAEVKGNFNQ